MQSLFQAIQCPIVWTCPTDDSDFLPHMSFWRDPKDTSLQRFKGFKPRMDDGECLTSVNWLALSF